MVEGDLLYGPRKIARIRPICCSTSPSFMPTVFVRSFIPGIIPMTLPMGPSFLTCDITEFNRLRLQYSRQSEREEGRRLDSKVALQWTIVLGHHVHGFRDR